MSSSHITRKWRAEGLNALPVRLQEQLISYLDYPSDLALSMTNRHFHRMIAYPNSHFKDLAIDVYPQGEFFAPFRDLCRTCELKLCPHCRKFKHWSYFRYGSFEARDTCKPCRAQIEAAARWLPLWLSERMPRDFVDNAEYLLDALPLVAMCKYLYLTAIGVLVLCVAWFFVGRPLWILWRFAWRFWIVRWLLDKVALSVAFASVVAYVLTLIA